MTEPENDNDVIGKVMTREEQYIFLQSLQVTVGPRTPTEWFGLLEWCPKCVRLVARTIPERRRLRRQLRQCREYGHPDLKALPQSLAWLMPNG